MVSFYKFLFLNLSICLLFFSSFTLSQGLPQPTSTPTSNEQSSSAPSSSSSSSSSSSVGDVNTQQPVDDTASTTPPPSVDTYLMAGNNQWSSTYAAHSNFMLDQERGTYTMHTYYTSRWSSISMSTINGWKKSYYNTLVLLLIVMDNYKSSDISSTSLTQIHNEFQIYRSAGVKTIIRFVYNDNMGSAKPWGDASSSAIVFRHIDQLQPILRINEDVIAYAQAGFVGLWGEWYYTDAFGDQGTYSAQNKIDRKTVVSKLMAALPNRAVQIRTPYWMKNFYGTNPLQAANYGTEIGRAGHHNDCYLADNSDMGTYDNYNTDYAYLSQQSKFTPSIFETCAVGSSRSLCPTALKETAGLHMVSGHRLYNTQVWNQWITGGCYDTILKNMGHRIEFVSSTSDVQANIGSTFNINVNIRNIGYASPSNSRLTEVIMRKVDGSSFCVATLSSYDIRTLQSNTNANIISNIRLPSTITTGKYELLMQFADPYSTLYAVPWYKIQAANNGIYEAGTGMHKLNAVIDILPASSPSPTIAGEILAKCGLSITSIINATVTSADTTCMSGYYKLNNVCTYCPPGSSCATATSTPVACASGTYSSGGQSLCLPCPSSCSGKGICGAKTGACICNTGFQGFDCSIVSGTTFAPTITPTTAKPTTKPVIPSTTAPASIKPTTTSPTSLKPSSATPSSTTKPTVSPTTINPSPSTKSPSGSPTTIVIPTFTAKPSSSPTPKTPSSHTPPSTVIPPTFSPSTLPPTGTATDATTIAPTGDECPKQENLLDNPAFGVVTNLDGTSGATAWNTIGDGYESVQRKRQAALKLTSFSLTRNVGAYQSITLEKPTMSMISFGGYISTAYVSGSMDYKFVLQMTLTYIDGVTENKSIYLATGSYGWKFRSMSFTPNQLVVKIDYKFSMIGHTGYAYLSQPVLGIVQTCALPLVTSDNPMTTSFESPVAFQNAVVLVDNGSDADSEVVADDSNGLSMFYITIIVACAGGLLLISTVAGCVWYKRRRDAKLDAAINNQLTCV